MALVNVPLPLWVHEIVPNCAFAVVTVKLEVEQIELVTPSVATGVPSTMIVYVACAEAGAQELLLVLVSVRSTVCPASKEEGV